MLEGNGLGAVDYCAHAPDIGAGEFAAGVYLSQHAVRIRLGQPGIDGHELRLRAGVRIGHLARLSATGGENFIVGKQDLRRQPLGLGDEIVAVVGRRRYAPQDYGVEKFGIVDHRILRETERKIERLECDRRGTGNIWIAAD